MKVRIEMRNALFVASAVMAAAVCAEPFEIGEALSDAAFWKSNPVMFVKKHQENGFKFTDENREGADSRLDGGVTKFKKFLTDVHQQVDKGIPLFWGLTLGIYPESECT